MDRPKYGAGALSAAWRQGLAELGAALKPLPDSIQQDVMGTIAQPTPQEVYRGKMSDPGQIKQSKDDIEMEK